ncbi:MAG TPA: GNAT family N-acetyltransferase [Thermoanaerobaculia bacterium]
MPFREIAYGSAEYDRERRLREEVLRGPLGLSLTAEDMAGEERQLHFGLFDSTEILLACVVAAPLSSTDARIRQMAVSPSRQGEGLGRRLMEEVEAELRARGFTRLALSARVSAVGFYEKLGYTAEGDEYVQHTIPHVWMTKSISP